VKKYLGHGGVGDCLIVILKLLELKDKDFVYHHLNTHPVKLKMCGELLEMFDIKYELLNCNNKVATWNSISHNYDKCFSMYAAGKIDVPPKSEMLMEAENDIERRRIGIFYGNHWEACRDEGLKEPFNSMIYPREDYIVVQPIAGLVGEREDLKRYSRHWKNRPIIEYVKDKFPNDKIIWVGSEDFEAPFGENMCGKLSIKDTFDVISGCSTFVGFNSVLLYWALYNQRSSHLFMDFQGRYDVRMHSEWKKYLTFVEDSGVYK
jgi:hypothetical protein